MSGQNKSDYAEGALASSVKPSLPHALRCFRSVLAHAARDPVYAGFVAIDPTVEVSIRAAARELARHPDDSLPFRRVLDCAIADPKDARRIAALSTEELGAEHFVTRVLEILSRA